MLDSRKQVTNNAGNYQVVDARNVAPLNLGSCATTTVSVIVPGLVTWPVRSGLWFRLTSAAALPP